ncbi:MAG: ATPase core protein [Actinomycetota bacterium]|nr:ATPase core protein [Actinomycetota bacterium]
MSGDPGRREPCVARMRLRNFTSVAWCDIALGPLAVLVGFNAAGKSNVLDALRFVGDALSTSLGQALATRGGLDQILHRSADDRQAETFAIEVDLVVGAHGTQARATYGFEIGRDEERRSAYTVRREQCTLTFGDGSTEEFTVIDGEIAGSSSPAIPDSAERGPVPEPLRGVPLGRPQDRLLLPAFALNSPVELVESAFRAMRFYELDSATLRKVEDAPTPARVLGARGENVGQVLGLIAAEYPLAKEELDGYLRSLVPQALGVDERRDGDFSTIEARFWTGRAGAAYWAAVNTGASAPGDPHVKVFRRHALSEGTVRSAGVLAALFQPEVLTGTIPLVAIEEPETAIHPSRAGALYDAVYETSRHTQVIVTTQSSDFLDSEYADASHLLVVEAVNGATRVGPVDEATRRFLTEHPSHLAELHRQGQLRPAPAPAPGSTCPPGRNQIP